ncbi:hypothetical protein RhiirA5_435820 [Rhizophagus irregularis]|uniref:Uncharacterized protein n=1 Tax=Rhizophagus irregularis TaxID=588596 RepID=A0A2N0NMU1_9GLOM|nr:hypothetical protein RhiirA5_435820 [Rhizophagus irregularis]
MEYMEIMATGTTSTNRKQKSDSDSSAELTVKFANYQLCSAVPIKIDQNPFLRKKKC